MDIYIILAILERLYTRDRLKKWGITNEIVYPMCNSELESHQHLFFACNITKLISQQLLKWLSVNRQSQGWEDEMEWAIRNARKKDGVADVYRATLSASVYYVWQEKNYMIFQNKSRNVNQIVRQIIQDLHCRGSLVPRLANTMNSLNYYL